MIHISRKTCIVLLWLVGAGLSVYNVLNEYNEFLEVKIETQNEITNSLKSLSSVTQKKTQNILQRIEINNRLMSKQKALIDLVEYGEAISDQELSQFQELLEISDSRIAVISTADGRIIYNTPRFFKLIQNLSISHRPLYGRTKETGYSWDIYFDTSNNAPSIMSSSLIKNHNGKNIGQIVIEHSIDWIPFLESRNTKLTLINDYYQVGFHNTKDGFQKVKIEPENAELFNKNETRPIPNIEEFKYNTTIFIEKVETFDISYFHLTGALYQNVLISKAKISERWSLFFMVPIQQELDQLHSEIYEIIEDLILFLILCSIIHKFINYHYKIRLLTFTDELTRLKNRQHYNEYMPPLLSLHDRGKIEYLGLIVIDVDKFKLVNDTYGHSVGDIVLKSLAAHLKQNSRDSDHIYRFGGEEFLIITEGDSLEQLVIFANRIRESVKDIEPIQKHIPDGIRISAGVAIREPRESLEALFQRTDHLLYKAKENGRNRVESA